MHMYVYKKTHLRCDGIGCTTASHRICAGFSFCVDGISIVVYFAAVKVVRAKGSNFPFVRHFTCCCSSPIISFFLLYPCTCACVRFSLLCCFCSAYSIVAPFPLAEYFIYIYMCVFACTDLRLVLFFCTVNSCSYYVCHVTNSYNLYFIKNNINILLWLTAFNQSINKCGVERTLHSRKQIVRVHL